MRVAVEVLHILIGVVVAAGLTVLAAWAYPPGAGVIWWCGIAAMVASVAMGIGPLHRALGADRRAP